MREIDDYKPGKNKRYHWDEWADGRWKLAEAGVDFDNPSTFRVALSQWSKVTRCTYKTETTPDGHIAFVIHPA
jgi:hypothetical protein